MGVACPQLSDEPSYTMVESSGGSCRCTCQDEFQEAQEQSSGCCSPHVFTSILLGILSCVLMTGGVFLAFHKWDPMWLMVSGVGVVLILIGTVLHCCNNLSQRPKRHAPGGKGCCARPIPPDHHGGHIMTNNGSLTEQLLPLSNARSVSQLSLNMLPGYFPPVVTAYGIEQHSAVVQNINRLVQQQQQQQQQQQPPSQPQSPGSISPGIASTAGKSFIVLSLPSDASAANIQNLVATVYQLDGSSTETTGNEANSVCICPSATTPVTIVKPTSTVPLVLKNAEVQTCNMWPAVTTPVASTSGESSAAAHTSATETSGQVSNSQPVLVSTNSGSTQTDTAPITENINLMDCLSDVSPICDIPVNACDNQLSDHNTLVNIPASPSSNLLDVSASVVSSAIPEPSSSILVDIPEPPAENIVVPSNNLLVDVVSSSPSTSGDQRDVLVDVSLNTDINCNNTAPLLEGLVNNNNNNNEQVGIVVESNITAEASGSGNLTELPSNVPEIVNPALESLNPELLASNSNLSAVDTDIDDGELMDRSSPPPSYEDVTLEGENVGAFGLAYGTI